MARTVRSSFRELPMGQALTNVQTIFSHADSSLLLISRAQPGAWAALS
jgi:hypothetical protein